MIKMYNSRFELQITTNLTKDEANTEAAKAITSMVLNHIHGDEFFTSDDSLLIYNANKLIPQIGVSMYSLVMPDNIPGLNIYIDLNKGRYKN